jgi:hypothetical protein
VHLGIGIESINFLKQGRERSGFRQDEGATGDPHLLGAFFLSGDVSPGSRILPHTNEDEPWDYALGLEGGDPGRGFPVGLGGEDFTVEEMGRHGKFTMP